MKVILIAFIVIFILIWIFIIIYKLFRKKKLTENQQIELKINNLNKKIQNKYIKDGSTSSRYFLDIGIKTNKNNDNEIKTIIKNNNFENSELNDTKNELSFDEIKTEGLKLDKNETFNISLEKIGKYHYEDESKNSSLNNTIIDYNINKYNPTI